MYGRLDCDYIDDLLLDYENRRREKRERDELNPRLIIDPSRRIGSDRTHPFVKALLAVAAGKVEDLVKEYRDIEKRLTREIFNEKMKSKLRKLTERAGQYLKQELEHIEETGESTFIDNELFSKQGVMLIPQFSQILLNEKRTVTLYVRSELIFETPAIATIKSDSPKRLKLIGPKLRYIPIRRKMIDSWAPFLYKAK